ncbi:hypothetical protein D9611_002229 [Ephemerocybe angulata]|uniref:Uncharacterized protein n=1 Tax=Ephemerocybe angulata TaxID=980116 RepID=A0A8H5C1B7_9AGAR|nr:hypothetical protein D9611_002229 [Tulosesus angulatus]
MSFSAARLLASSISRRVRPTHIARSAPRFSLPAPGTCQRRTLFNFGKSEPTPELSEEDVQARAKAITETLMQKEEWKKIASHSGALAAMQNLLQVLGRKGINVGSGQPPKFTDMMRLAADAEFREAVNTMKAEMKDAGVDLDNPELVKSLMSMASPPSK